MQKPIMQAPRSSDEPVADQSRAWTASPLLWILLIGAVIRGALWVWFQDLPIRIWDEQDYNKLARNLVEHGAFALEPGQELTSIRPPLYPVFVAGIYGLFGVENFQAVRLIQAVVSLVNVMLLYWLGAAVFSRRVGYWVAGLFCYYPSFLGYNNLLLTEVLFTFWLCLTCALVVRSLQRQSLGCLAGAGAVLGLAALTRSVLWLFPPVLVVFLLLTWKGSLGRRLAAASVVVVPFALVLAPWAVRNTRLQHTLVAVDVMGGRNFMMGNYRYTPLYRSWDAIVLEGEQSWVHEVCTVYPPQERQTQGQIDKLALRQGLQFVRENPGLTLRRDTVKFFDFWGLERELIKGAADGFFGPISRSAFGLLTLLIPGYYVITLLLGILGATTTPPADRRVHWFLLLVIGFVCGMHTLVFAHSRYHLPLMPLVLLFAAGAVIHARQAWQQPQRLPFWLACALSGLLVGGWLWLFVAVDGDRFWTALRSLG
jgi:4-amino-4-deoxy-L-arabinose transferase-like glycosyltransferase